MTNQFIFDFYNNGILIFGTELVAAPIALCLTRDWSEGNSSLLALFLFAPLL